MSEKSNLLELIPERKKLFGTTISDLLDKFNQFSGKTLILLDIETLGLNPGFEYEQITEVAAISVRGEDMEILDTFNYRVELSESASELLEDVNGLHRYSWERRQKKRGRGAMLDPNDVLAMTQYYKIKAPTLTERLVIEKLYSFIETYEDPILVAHNAEFDVRYLTTRGNTSQLNFPEASVLDTLKISQFFFVPALEVLKHENDASDLHQSLLRRNKKSSHVSSRLGELAVAFGINAENWHTAMSDVMMMKGVLEHILKFLEKYKNTDISIPQERAIRKTLRNGSRIGAKNK